MEQFKEWVKGHKALAIGGGLALLVLLYLWLRSGSSAPAGDGSNAALGAYYQAEASSMQGAAAQAISTNQLAAQTNQTNAERDVALAQTDAAKAPYQAQLDAILAAINLSAYHDYLSEQAGAGSSTTYFEGISKAGTPVLWNGAQGPSSTLTNPMTGQVEVGGNQSFIWDQLPAGWNANPERVNWNGVPGSAPTAPVAPTAVVQPADFKGFAVPTL